MAHPTEPCELKLKTKWQGMDMILLVRWGGEDWWLLNYGYERFQVSVDNRFVGMVTSNLISSQDPPGTWLAIAGHAIWRYEQYLDGVSRA